MEEQVVKESTAKISIIIIILGHVGVSIYEKRFNLDIVFTTESFISILTLTSWMIVANSSFKANRVEG